MRLNGLLFDDNAKGRTRTTLFVGVLFGPFRAQIASILLVGVGHCLCLFVLIVALVSVFYTGYKRRFACREEEPNYGIIQANDTIIIIVAVRAVR